MPDFELVFVRDKKTKDTYKYAKGLPKDKHGLTTYNNYGCRCPICREAKRKSAADYRERTYAGRPLCQIKGCPRVMSRAVGNGLCAKHWEEVKVLREKKVRAATKRKATLARKRRLKAAA